MGTRSDENVDLLTTLVKEQDVSKALPMQFDIRKADNTYTNKQRQGVCCFVACGEDKRWHPQNASHVLDTCQLKRHLPVVVQ